MIPALKFIGTFLLFTGCIVVMLALTAIGQVCVETGGCW